MKMKEFYVCKFLIKKIKYKYKYRNENKENIIFIFIFIINCLILFILIRFNNHNNHNNHNNNKNRTAAVQCAVLAGAGPQRSRTLATLYKDERTHNLPSFSILEKTYLERVIRPNEVSEFATTLKPHHVAKLADNSTTVFDRAIIEHNLLAASKIYNNITIEELGTLLNISSEQAEQVAAHMIGENRLGGNIDQISRLITFIPLNDQQLQLTSFTSIAAAANNEEDTLSSKHVEHSMQAIMNWDSSIQSICHDLDTIISSIQKKYPEYVDSHFKSMA